jgi:hypothetical protein
MLKTTMISIKRKHKLETFSIPQRAWRLPPCPGWVKKRGETVQNYLANLFIGAAETFEESNYSVVRVSVKKDDLTAVFGVNVKRTSYFFQDRDITLTQRGVKKRIFHIVRAHDRLTRNGVQHVKIHFRGLREFEWAGYKVLITVPGRHHQPLAELHRGWTDDYWTTKDGKWISMPEEGKMLAAGIRGDSKTVRKIAAAVSARNGPARH